MPAPTDGQPCPIAEDGYPAVFRVQLDLFDAFDVDDVAAVDADEAVGVELSGDFADRLLLPELRARGGEEDRVVGGFDVVEAGDGDDLDGSILAADGDALQRFGAKRCPLPTIEATPSALRKH